MSLRSFRSTLMGCAFLLVFVLPKLVQAQAWLPLEGQGQITVTYENIFVRDHFDLPAEGLEGPLDPLDSTDHERRDGDRRAAARARLAVGRKW